MTKEMFTEAFEETMKNDVMAQGNKEEFTVQLKELSSCLSE